MKLRLGVISAALVLALHSATRKSAWSLALGAPILLAVGVASVAITSLWLFSQVPGLVYQVTPAQRLVAELAYRALVVPTSNRCLFASLLAVALAFGPGLRGRLHAARHVPASS